MHVDDKMMGFRVGKTVLVLISVMIALIIVSNLIA